MQKLYRKHVVEDAQCELCQAPPDQRMPLCSTFLVMPWMEKLRSCAGGMPVGNHMPCWCATGPAVHVAVAVLLATLEAQE